jgi:hypothetical protein
MHPHKSAAESSAKAKHSKIMKACGGKADGGATFNERFGNQPASVGSDGGQQATAKAQKMNMADGLNEPMGQAKQAKSRGGRLDRKYARGGRAKGHTHVNVVVAPQGGKEPVPVPVGGGMGAPPMAPPPRPPMAPPMGGPPGAGGPPGGGMPMRAKGGRVPSHPKPSYPKPKYTKTNKGYPLDSGSLTGEGRLEKIDAYGSKKKASGGSVRASDERGSDRDTGWPRTKAEPEDDRPYYQRPENSPPVREDRGGAGRGYGFPDGPGGSNYDKKSRANRGGRK